MELETATVKLCLRKMSGQELQVVLNASSTVRDLKDAVAHEVETVLGLRLVTEAGQFLERDAAGLAEYGVGDGQCLMMSMESARDYTRISSSSVHVINCIRHPSGLLITAKGDLLVSHYYGELSVYNALHEEVKVYNLPGTYPCQMATAPTGELLVAFMREPNRIGIFDFEAVELRREQLDVRRWIGNGLEASGLALHGDRIFVSESWQRLSVFSLETGKLLQVIEGFNSPRGLAIVEDSFLLSRIEGTTTSNC